MTQTEIIEKYGTMFRSGKPEIPDEWLVIIESLCKLVEQTIPPERLEDFTMDVYCDRGDYPMSVDILTEPSDIDMTAIKQAAEAAMTEVRMLTN